MVRWAYDTEEYDKAVHYTSEMLRLCPRDNLGVRDWLPSLFLQACRPSDALSFVQQWSTPAAQEGELLPGGGTHFATPSQEPLSDAEVERQIKGWAHPQIMYSGALAAFQLWGHCELARQYLSIARSHNTHVLIRILSRQERPLDLDKSQFRLANSADRASAKDYLYFTQQLWMVPDVFDWVANSPEVVGKVMRPCGRNDCEKIETKANEYKQCRSCYEVWVFEDLHMLLLSSVSEGGLEDSQTCVPQGKGRQEEIPRNGSTPSSKLNAAGSSSPRDSL
ncbi:hypothetical protein FRB95_005795 [Tulasnella sp. JGI-2019a]|nr:hypothetical protein FRB95_005795 [Tulasnella sp. JGI-2019a]